MMMVMVIIPHMPAIIEPWVINFHICQSVKISFLIPIHCCRSYRNRNLLSHQDCVYSFKRLLLNNFHYTFLHVLQGGNNIFWQSSVFGRGMGFSPCYLVQTSFGPIHPFPCILTGSGVDPASCLICLFPKNI
jgi:hypothetical protein